MEAPEIESGQGDTRKIKTDRKNPSDFLRLCESESRKEKTPSTSMRTADLPVLTTVNIEAGPLSRAEKQPNAVNTHLTRSLGLPR
jgi:hypothetical protein